MRKVSTMLLTVAVVLLVAVVIGVVLADRLMPKRVGAPAQALPVQPAATALDRAVVPLLDAHPGQTGAVLINDGLAAFAARALAVRGAGRSLDLQYYMWRDDLAGRLLALEVWRAAERGVRVRLLLDDLNARGLDPQLLALDAHPNIELRLYNPFRNRRGIRRVLETVVRALRINHRMHNKAWIADGRVAVVGGRNIGDEYFSAAEGTNFRDLDLLLVGPAVAGTEAIFDRYWNSDTVVPLAALGEKSRRRMQQLLDDARAQIGSPQAQRYLARVQASPGVQEFLTRAVRPLWSARIEVVADPPQKWRRDDRSAWLVQRLAGAIGSAAARALLVSPYFVPGDAGRDALLGLAGRGVAVGVVTNSLAANDVPAVHSGYARYRERLLRGGVALHELRAQGRTDTSLFGSSGASLHTKAFVVDGQRGFVGSFNLDPRSAMLNTEMGVLFDDAGLGAAVEAEYHRLAGPGFSYDVVVDDRGRLRWRDGLTSPPTLLEREPGASLWRRVVAVVLGWLPIETQL